METGAGWRSGFGVSSNDAKRHVWSFDGTYASDELDSRSYTSAMRLSMQLTDRFSVAIVPGYQRTENTRQYFSTLLNGRPETVDRRYVFATLDQTTDGTTITRLEDGSYVVTDGTRTFTLANGDFNVSSLRGNAVVRWDFAQGSSLYLVWSQNRAVEDARGERVGVGDLTDVFDAPRADIFAVKMSYRFDFR
jgi:hypothetical protein